MSYSRSARTRDWFVAARVRNPRGRRCHRWKEQLALRRTRWHRASRSRRGWREARRSPRIIYNQSPSQNPPPASTAWVGQREREGCFAPRLDQAATFYYQYVL